jgi:hypothetical protein
MSNGLQPRRIYVFEPLFSPLCSPTDLVGNLLFIQFLTTEGALMRFFVTGGVGLIGSKTVKNFVKDKHEVLVLDDSSLGRKENVSSSVEVFKEGMCDHDLEKIVGRGIYWNFCDATSNPAPMFYTDPRERINVNVRSFLNAVEVARRYDMLVVYLSTFSLYNRCQPPHKVDMKSDQIRSTSIISYVRKEDHIALCGALQCEERKVKAFLFTFLTRGTGKVRKQHIPAHMGNYGREVPCNIWWIGFHHYHLTFKDSDEKLAEIIMSL